MDTPLLKITGPGRDLEVVYMHNPDRSLPHPKGTIPFEKQGVQLMFDQPHVSRDERNQMIDNKSTNPLPLYGDRFVGQPLLSKLPRQINQPGFLSVNEDIYF